MIGRVLAVVLAGDEVAALDGMATVVAAARTVGGRVRVASFRPLPPARVNRHGWIVADCDREMDRITRTTVEAFAEATRAIRDVAVETVVRFGAPARELRLEIDGFTPDLVAFFESATAPARHRFRAWMIRRQLGRLHGIRVVVVKTPRARRARPLRVPAPVWP